MKRTTITWTVAAGAVIGMFAPSCQVPLGGGRTDIAADLTLDTSNRDHLHEVMTSAFCGKCHPAMYAEHNQNTHGRAFTDNEPRLATGRFDHGDCIRCHTPRPIFETGIGMNPMQRHHNLEEGNTCMTCHWRPDYDYGSFFGGAQCRTAFHPDVGKVEACGSCHRNHGTPYQWEKSPIGKGKDRSCMDCHMKEVVRPVAVGQPPRRVRSHVFPGSRSEEQLRRAYSYSAKIDGNQLVVRITNDGAGHNFPTELKQRSLESFIVVKDLDGKVVSESRMVFRDPYKRPYGLHLPVNTQIPSGEYREHRVPIKVPAGTVQAELHYKLYFPIEDHHPDLARRLEVRQIPFDAITPSDEEVVSAPVVKAVMPEGTTFTTASAANMVDFNREIMIGKVEVPIPQGDGPQAIKELIDLFMFPVPAAQGAACKRLLEIGAPAVPALMEALGSWDNKTWKHATKVLFAMGERVRDDLTRALGSDQLYVRIHSRELLAMLGRPHDVTGLDAALRPGLTMANALDRSSTAEVIGKLRLQSAAPALRPLLAEEDPDVVSAAAIALARLEDADAAPAIVRALGRSPFVESKRELARALALLGDPVGIPLLIQGLDHGDDLIREKFFEALFEVTGLHMGYDALAPRPQRLEAISRLSAYWTRSGSAEKLRRPWPPSQRAHDTAWHLVEKLADQTDDGSRSAELTRMGNDAVPALVLGLKFPPGFATKRDRILRCLGEIGSKEAAPFVASALRDPVVAVASQACLALTRIKDPATLPALEYYHSHLLSQRAAETLPKSADADLLLARAAAARLILGDQTVRSNLVNHLLSPSAEARRTAHQALVQVFGGKHGYDPDGDEDGRRAAARRWQLESGN